MVLQEPASIPCSAFLWAAIADAAALRMEGFKSDHVSLCHVDAFPQKSRLQHCAFLGWLLLLAHVLEKGLMICAVLLLGECLLFFSVNSTVKLRTARIKQAVFGIL